MRYYIDRARKWYKIEDEISLRLPSMSVRKLVRPIIWSLTLPSPGLFTRMRNDKGWGFPVICVRVILSL